MQLPLHRLTDRGRKERAYGFLRVIHARSPHEAHLAADALTEIANRTKKERRPTSKEVVDALKMDATKERLRRFVRSLPKSHDRFFKAGLRQDDFKYDQFIEWAIDFVKEDTAHPLPVKRELKESRVGYLPAHLQKEFEDRNYSRILLGILLSPFIIGNFIEPRTSAKGLEDRKRRIRRNENVLQPDPEIHMRYGSELANAIWKFRKSHPLPEEPKMAGL